MPFFASADGPKIKEYTTRLNFDIKPNLVENSTSNVTRLDTFIALLVEKNFTA